MRTYTIFKKGKNLNWNDIPVAPIDTQLWTPEIDITATAQVCYDTEALYIRLAAKETNIRSEEKGPIGSPCKDSCLEFFFSPVEEDNRYFNVEFNPEKCMYLGLGTSRYDLVRLLPNSDDIFKASSLRTNDDWEITYQIPFSFIKLFFKDFVAVSGKKIRANFSKCGDLTVQKHYFSWNHINLATPDFHCPEFFGKHKKTS